MNYLGKVINNFRSAYNEINAATLTGAIDIVVVEQPDGSFTCSPFHVRFGKIGVLRSREKVVDLEINGEAVDIHMKLGESGEAFFVEGVDTTELGDNEFIPPHLACSPIPLDEDRYICNANHDSAHWERFDDSPEIKESDDDGQNDVTPLVVLAGNVLKTFKAETVESAPISADAEFCPIVESMSQERESEDSVTPSGSISASASVLNFAVADLPFTERMSSSAPANKRKRRKKSLLKKKPPAMIIGNLQHNSTSDEAPSQTDEVLQSNLCDHQQIFQIEDLDSSKDEKLPKSSNNIDGLELCRINDAPVEKDLHFFSDTEITPGSSPNDKHHFTPVQSDSELEINRSGSSMADSSQRKGGDDSRQRSWRWGELPTSSRDDSQQDGAPSVIHNMLGFMKKTKHIRHSEEGMFSFMKKTKQNQENEGGIYLSDLNIDALEPEVAALYFPSAYKQSYRRGSHNSADLHVEAEDAQEEDNESGNGPSLPHSPHSVFGAIGGGSKPFDSDFEYHKLFGDISISLCGSLDNEGGPSEEKFLEHLVKFEDLASNPQLIENTNLVARLSGKLYNWRTAAPIIMSLVLFQKPLPEESVARICADFMPVPNTSQPADVESAMKSGQRGYSSWFNWTRTGHSKPGTESSPLKSGEIVPLVENQAANLETEKEPSFGGEDALQKLDTSLEPLESSSPQTSDSELESAHLLMEKSQSLAIPLEKSWRTHIVTEKYRKTLRLTSEQIASLNLRDGANEIEFSVTTAYQGTSRCKCFLFRWRYDDKIVVSDIDGTITKSDVLGHILPIVGKDWAQSGVAKLFTKIKDNGYKLLYLSARAIGQSKVTREYLKSIKQEDLSLPEGPMLLNPTSLLNALHTEVIEKKPEEFKISCLRDIQALFPVNSKPFYAGYGNKINDVWAYQAVGIPIFRIFTINHRGELKHELTQTFQSTYSNMSYIVDQMFPAQPGTVTLDDFSHFVYWREPILELNLQTSTEAASAQ